MPSGRSKEDTWNAKELEKSIKDSKDDRQRSKDKDRDRHRDKDRDRDRDKPRDKDRDRDREKRREKDRDRDKPREKDRDREHRRRDKDEDRKERRHQDKENGHRDDKHRSKRADEGKKDQRRPDRKPKDYNEEPRRHRKYKEYYDEDIDPDREKRRERRHRDKDEDTERRKERRHKERDEDYYVEWGASKEEKKERRHRDDRDDKRDRDRDRDRRDKDKDKDRRRDKDERRRHRDRDENEESRHKDRDEEDDHERRRRERKERKKREQEEKERQEKEQKEKEKRSQAEFISPPPQPDSNVLNRTWTYDDPSTTEVQNLYDGYESDFEPATESSRSSSCAMPSAVPVSSTRSADLFLESHHSLREKSSHDVGHDNPATSHRTKSQLESKSDTKLFEEPTNIRPSEHSVAHVASSSNDEEEAEKVPVAVSLSRKPSLTSVHSLTLQKQPSSKSVVRKFSSSQKESDNSMHSISLTKHKRANADLKSEKDSKGTLVKNNVASEKTSAAPSKVDLDHQPGTSCSSNRVLAAAAEDQYVGTTLRTGEKIVSIESLLARSGKDGRGARRKRSYPKVEKSSKGTAQPQQILSKKSKEATVEGKDSKIEVKTSEVQHQASNANDEDTEVPEEIQKPVEDKDTSNLKMFGSLNQGLDEILKNYEMVGSDKESQEKPKEPSDLENSQEQNQPLEQEQPHQQQQRNSSQQQRSATQQQKSISHKAQPRKQTQEMKPSKPEGRLPQQGRIPRQQQKSPTQQKKTPAQQQKTPPQQQKNTPPAQQRRPSLQQERSMKNSPTKTPADGKSPAAPKGTSSSSRRSSTSGPGKDSSPGKGQPSAGRGSVPATRGQTTDGSSRRGSMKEMPYSKNTPPKTRTSPQSYGKGKMDDSTKPRQNERRRSDPGKPGNVQKGSRNPPRKGDGGHSKNTDTKASVRSRDTLKKANIDPKQRRGSTHDGGSKEKINDKRLKPGTRKTQEDAIFDEAISLMQAEDLLKVTDDHNQLAESNAAIRYKSLSRSSSQHERSPTPWDKSGSGHDLVLKSGSSGLLNAGSFAEEEEDDYNYDDEDFEDYADDFEDDADDFDDDDDDDDSRHSSQKQNGTSKHRDNDDEMDDILQAMNKENDRLMADNERNQRQRDRDRDSSPPRSQRPPSGRTFINFSSARQRAVSSKAATKAARRGIELLQMVEMDTAAYDMFDMPPVTEYNMYMRSFGSSNTKQAYIQTNDDNIDRELQTEEIEYTDKWCQHPPAEILSCGGADDSPSPDAAYQPIDAPDLGAFLDAAGQVMCVLMEEAALSRRDTRDAHGTDTKQSDIVVSDAFSELNVPGFLSDRPVIHSHISAVQTHMLITVHQTPDKPSSDQLKRQGCLCVWNINEPSQPQKILVCESRPQCCCFSPTKTSLVFSGMHDGSVVVWDLREAASMHRSHRARGKEWTLRGPTYNTAGILAYDNHQSGVMAVHPIVAAGESESASLSGLSQSDSSEGLSFQLATLEENGIINLWVVVELLTPDLAGSESDFGLAPGGKVRLVKSSTINLDNPLRDIRLRTTMKCADLQLLPANNSHYFVASDTGCVIHGLRYGGKAPPRAYRPLVDNPVQITTIDFSPFTEPVFLTGCADGSLRLYHVDTEWPLVVWLSSTGGRPIQRVAWCRSRPAVFFVLDTDAKLYIWDLLMDDSGPLKQEAIAQSRVTSLALSNDHSATGLGLPGRRPQMVVCLESGACEVHTISQQFSALMADEMDQFSAFLQRNS